MKIEQFDAKNKKSWKAGWSAISSGIIGLGSFGALISAVIGRDESTMSRRIWILFRTHDAGAILQFSFLLPVVFVLWEMLKYNNPTTTSFFRNLGVGAIGFTILFLLLIFPNILADVLYMFPQGFFGVWLIVINWKLKGKLPTWIRWFGIVVGLGLIMVGVFPPGYVFLVDPILARIPAAPPEVIENMPINTPANIVLHQLLTVGSIVGVLLLPIWSIALGIVLMKKKLNHGAVTAGGISLVATV